jgi:hypothetical protein
MKADVNEITRDLEAPWHSLRTDRHVCDAALLKNIEDFFVNPGWVAELDRVANLTIEGPQEILQPREILFKGTGKLPENRSPMFA